jgi:hypothetical protein
MPPERPDHDNMTAVQVMLLREIESRKLREVVAEAIWLQMAPSHLERWQDEPDPNLYRGAAQAAIDAVRWMDSKHGK